MGDEANLKKRFGQADNELQSVALSSPGDDGTSGELGWDARCDGSFVRDTDAVSEHDINNGTDLWIVTES